MNNCRVQCVFPFTHNTICFILSIAAFQYVITDGKGGTAQATVVVNVIAPTQPNPITDKPTFQPTHLPAMTCEDMCFEPLDPDQCPSCDPSILPSCSSIDSTTLGVGELCESDGECKLIMCIYHILSTYIGDRGHIYLNNLLATLV